MAGITGITGKFHSICNGVNSHNNNATPENYYGGKEARVLLEGGKMLNVQKGDNKFKLTLVTHIGEDGTSGNSAIELHPISFEEMRMVLERGTLSVCGEALRILNTRPLRKIAQ